MKYTTKQILEMTEEQRQAKCGCRCETKYCLFKPSLRELREDGFCVADSLKYADQWIIGGTREIGGLKAKINIVENRIKQYKSWKRKLEKEMSK